MNVESLIQAALIEEGIVTLPSFGSFVVRYQTARLVKEEQIKFKPPQYVVVFSQTIDDGNAFVSYVSDVMQCPQEEAETLLSKYVEDINNAMREQRDFVVDGVGVIHPDKSFESAISPDSFPETYGLTDFAIDKLLDAEEKKAKEKPLKIAKAAGKALFIASPILFGAFLIPNILQISQSAQFASMFRNTAVNMDFSSPEIPSPSEYKPLGAVAQIDEETVSFEQLQGTQTVETRQEATNKVVERPAQEDKKSEISKQKQTAKLEKTNSSDAKYYIIVGTFLVKENAEKYSMRLKGKDYDAGVLKDEGKTRVYLSAFADKNEAQEFINDLHSKSEYNNAWLYVKES